MDGNQFKFSSYLIMEDDIYVAVCRDVDIVSEGLSENEAINNLSEAVALYIESAIEGNLPILRPITQTDDVSLTDPARIIKTWPLTIDFKVTAHA
ncbi:hypothetical protein GF406_10365 [candidate division KSB1 bacterium]|nr:hypothetical protein [candidate division KSB1 bacterium]